MKTPDGWTRGQPVDVRINSASRCFILSNRPDSTVPMDEAITEKAIALHVIHNVDELKRWLCEWFSDAVTPEHIQRVAYEKELLSKLDPLTQTYHPDQFHVHGRREVLLKLISQQNLTIQELEEKNEPILKVTIDAQLMALMISEWVADRMDKGKEPDADPFVMAAASAAVSGGAGVCMSSSGVCMSDTVFGVAYPSPREVVTLVEPNDEVRLHEVRNEGLDYRAKRYIDNLFGNLKRKLQGIMNGSIFNQDW